MMSAAGDENVLVSEFISSAAGDENVFADYLCLKKL